MAATKPKMRRVKNMTEALDPNPEGRLRRRLEEIAAEKRPIGDRHFFIYRSEGARMYLSGNPYLWSVFSERAYVFADEEQAEGLISEFAGTSVLARCKVGSWGP